MDKKMVKILFVILLIFIIVVIFYNLFKNTIFESYLKKKIENVNLDNFIVTTMIDGELNAKTYNAKNQQLSEYYNSYGENDFNIYSDFNKKKMYFYNPIDISNIEEKDITQEGNISSNNDVINFIEDNNEKFEYIEKIKCKDNKEYYVVKFTNKSTNDIKIMFINKENNLLEKYIFFVAETDEIIVYEYIYEFNQDVKNKMPNFE